MSDDFVDLRELLFSEALPTKPLTLADLEAGLQAILREPWHVPPREVLEWEMWEEAQ